ncbi:MAG: hypothetical protein ABSC06_28195 [Rhodopila sp.]
MTSATFIVRTERLPIIGAISPEHIASARQPAVTDPSEPALMAVPSGVPRSSMATVSSAPAPSSRWAPIIPALLRTPRR